MADFDLEAILKRLELLEKENHSLRAEVEELKSNDIEIKSELNTINRFISAMTESRSIDEVMTEIESAAKQLTDSDEVTFFCMDNVNDKFFAEDEGRNWQSKAGTDFLKSVSDNQEIRNNGTKAYIPLVSGNGRSLGVIEAERSGGFNTDVLSRYFSKGGTFVENIKLGLEKEYQHQGRITDELTKMFNRQGLNEYLENTVVKALAEGKSVNILMADIDHFKDVNDTYGHDAGDVILKGTAAVFKEMTKDGAGNCFRIGGEEMAAILITDAPEQAVDMAETLRRNIEKNANIITRDGNTEVIMVTASIGVHEMQPDIPVTLENVREVFNAELKKADKALYEAKETGRNKVVCADEFNYISYLAMKATEVFVKSEGIENQEAIDGIADMIADSFVYPAEEQGLDAIVDALRTYSVQTSEKMPEISSLADIIADKIEEYSEKNAEYTDNFEEEIIPSAEIQNGNKAEEIISNNAAEKILSEELSYYETPFSGEGTTFAERIIAIKEWAEKASEKAAEKDKAQEKNPKKDGDAR